MKIVRLNPFRRIVIILLLIAAAVSGAYFVFSRKGSDIITALKGSQNQYNVVLITIDTLRADRLGCYGYGKNTSPEIDKFAENAIRFENSIVQSPYTGPSHSSILTGKYVAGHGVLSNGYKLPLENNTIAEVLKEYGYTTAASIGAWVLDKRFNYGQGFDAYMQTNKEQRIAADVNRDLFKWLENNKDKKFFAWAHYYDVHCPYYAPELFRNKFSNGYKGILNTDGKCGLTYYNSVKLGPDDIEYVKAMYDAEIAYTDSNVGELLNNLKKWGVYDNTLIIITSDHGESLYERGKIGHNLSLYDCEIKAPLLIRYPGMKSYGTSIKTQVESISIMPTILDILGINVPLDINGKSFLNLLEGNREDESPAYVRLGVEKGLDLQYAIRTAATKLIFHESGTKELYDLKADSEEKNNIINDVSRGSMISELSPKLDKFMVLEKKANTTKGEGQQLKKESLEKLRALGYVQ